MRGMFAIPFHKRLRDMRDRTIRQPDYRTVYAHALMVAHMSGRLIADDHPGWARIEEAVQAARAGDLSALDIIEREIARMMGDGVKPPAIQE
ncbi:hypothetical protein M3484_22265 [Pseudomonas sp. GX19020]|uniref:hypothetical protein n=1 Tax=Pseudomonas sp. GX19020 TaxID=2942277 RepID=UPI002019C3E8|nr:hypothetical protein [Pseudomonas sp. GX19020]MCL4069286.1 hypothetical protein [Pseudomonas sp. GX19020]